VPPIIEAVDGARPLILVGDDDPLVRTLVKHVLEREGFELVLVEDGREVVEELGRRQVDLVLLDVNMPVKNGLQALREIRADDRFRTLPVILVTGSATEADRVRGLETGANDYLVKPFAIDELAARVRAQFRSQAAWTHQLARGRESRRRLAASLDTIPRDVPLVLLAATLVERLSRALDVDGVAILHFTRGSARAIAASGALRSRFQPTRSLSRAIGREVIARAQTGPWLEDTAAWPGVPDEAVEVAYVPFRLGPTARPLGCLLYALRPGSPTGPLSHRLADIIDATDFTVAVLRPAVEQAETNDAALNRIQRLISRRDFAIYLQPIVRLEDDSVMAVEALARFASGLPPDAQFAEAATLGLGLALERAAVVAAIEATASLPDGVALSANLSGDVIQNDETLGELLRKAGRNVIVELTEHEPIDDYAALRAALAGFGPAVKLAVDDAGSGYSSLRHILALQPAYVKLDMEWVRGIDQDPVRRSLVTGLDYFARETGCELIAEGIETAAELAALRELGIPYGQGYLLGRPEPAR
jgi:EAL domain-containing protein (putative c-di-GMP-specific phosphodiesterase class I)/DNA-binding response OmpR family regulator